MQSSYGVERAEQHEPATKGRGRFMTALPLRLALALVAGVWLAGCVWSFREQTDLAAWAGFDVPPLLPLVLDGLAVGMAAVAW